MLEGLSYGDEAKEEVQVEDESVRIRTGDVGSGKEEKSEVWDRVRD